MQDESSYRIDRLEQRIAELRRENAQLKSDLNGLRLALRELVGDIVATFDEIEEQTLVGKQRLEQTLGRPFTDAKLIDELTRRKVTS